MCNKLKTSGIFFQNGKPQNRKAVTFRLYTSEHLDSLLFLFDKFIGDLPFFYKVQQLFHFHSSQCNLDNYEGHNSESCYIRFGRQNFDCFYNLRCYLMVVID